MAGSPQWKIYRSGDYVAACKYPSDAAVLVAASGGEVRFGHGLVVWKEGAERFSAGESYDMAAQHMEARANQKTRESYDRAHGKGAAADLIARHAAKSP